VRLKQKSKISKLKKWRTLSPAFCAAARTKDTKDDAGSEQSFWRQVGGLLRWLRALGLPLIGLLFILVYQYLRTYFADEGMPLNVLSESIFVALPAFFLMVSFFILAGVFLVFFQTCFLFIPVEGDGKNLLYVLREKKAEFERVCAHKNIGIFDISGKVGIRILDRYFFEGRLFQGSVLTSIVNIIASFQNFGFFLVGCYKLICNVLYGLDESRSTGRKTFYFCILAFFIPWVVLSIVNYNGWGDGWVFWVVRIGLFNFMVFQGMFLLRNVIYSRSLYIGALSVGFRLTALLSIFVQLCFLVLLNRFVFEWYQDAGLNSWLWAVFLAAVVFVFIMFLFGYQFWLANEAGRGADMLKKSGAHVFALAALIAVVPPASNYLTGKVLSEAVSGHRKCAVLLWTEDHPQAIADIQSRENGRESVDLRVLAEIDGYYLVRQYGENLAGTDVKPKVNYVPRALVAGIRSCTPETNGREPAQPFAAEQISTN